MRVKGYAPGWRLRCPKCGHTQDAAEAGIIRVAASSWKKRVLRRCPNCGRITCIILERAKDTDPQP